MRKLFILLLTASVMLVQAQSPDRTELLIDAYGKFLCGSYQEAISIFDQLIKSEYIPQPEWYLYKGIAEFKLGHSDPAKINILKAERSGNVEAYLWDARIEMLLGNSKESLLYIEKYLKLNERPDIQSIKKDSIFIPLHNLPEWFSLWQNDWQNDIQKIEEEVDFNLRKKDYLSAHSFIDNALTNNTNEGYLHALKSTVYNLEGNTQLALNEVNIALVSDPENTEFLKKKVQYLVLLSQYDNAMNVLSKILSATPGDFDARYSRACVAMNAGNYETAKKDITVYLRYFRSAEAEFLAGKIYYNAGDYLESLRYLNPLIEKDKSNASYFKARGMTYYQTQTYKEAAYDLSMSLDLFPDDAETNYYLGLTEQILGHKKLACYYLNRAKTYGDMRAEQFIRENCSR